MSGTLVQLSTLAKKEVAIAMDKYKKTKKGSRSLNSVVLNTTNQFIRMSSHMMYSALGIAGFILSLIFIGTNMIYEKPVYYAGSLLVLMVNQLAQSYHIVERYCSPRVLFSI